MNTLNLQEVLKKQNDDDKNENEEMSRETPTFYQKLKTKGAGLKIEFKGIRPPVPLNNTFPLAPTPISGVPLENPIITNSSRYQYNQGLDLSPFNQNPNNQMEEQKNEFLPISSASPCILDVIIF